MEYCTLLVCMGSESEMFYTYVTYMTENRPQTYRRGWKLHLVIWIISFLVDSIE